MGHFSGVTLAPMWFADPVAEFQPVLSLVQSRTAYETAATRQRYCVMAATMFARASALNELLRIRLGVRIRHACEHFGHSAIVRQLGQFLNVVRMGWAQHQP